MATTPIVASKDMKYLQSLEHYQLLRHQQVCTKNVDQINSTLGENTLL